MPLGNCSLAGALLDDDLPIGVAWLERSGGCVLQFKVESVLGFEVHPHFYVAKRFEFFEPKVEVVDSQSAGVVN